MHNNRPPTILTLVVVLIFFSFSIMGVLGCFTQSQLTTITQNGKYIGYKMEQKFKAPWESSETYTTIDLTRLIQSTEGGYIEWPEGNYYIYNPIQIGDQPTTNGQLEVVDGCTMWNTDITRRINPSNFDTVTFPADCNPRISYDEDGSLIVKYDPPK